MRSLLRGKVTGEVCIDDEKTGYERDEIAIGADTDVAGDRPRPADAAYRQGGVVDADGSEFVEQAALDEPGDRVAGDDARRQTCREHDEQNAGQMIDDVRLAILGEAPVVPIGGISSDEAGFGIGPLLDVEVIRDRIECALAGREVEQ